MKVKTKDSLRRAAGRKDNQVKLLKRASEKLKDQRLSKRELPDLTYRCVQQNQVTRSLSYTQKLD